MPFTLNGDRILMVYLSYSRLEMQILTLVIAVCSVIKNDATPRGASWMISGFHRKSYSLLKKFPIYGRKLFLLHLGLDRAHDAHSYRNVSARNQCF